MIARWDPDYRLLLGPAGERLYLEDLPPRVFVVGPCPWADLARVYAGPGDLAIGRPGEPRSLQLGAQGSVILSLDSAWGWNPTGGEPGEFLRRAEEVALSIGCPELPESATGLLFPLLKKARVPLAPLVSTEDTTTADVRLVAGLSVNQGPQVLCAGGEESASEYDLRSAYLHGLRERMPMGVAQDWRDVRKLPVKLILSGTGLVSADVRVLSASAIPPLPCRQSGVTLWPVGEFRYRGAISVLRDAVFRGEAEVVQVRRAWHARRVGEPLAPLANLIERMPKPWSKLAYTRAFGLFASAGRLACPAEQLGQEEQTWSRLNPGIRRGWRPDWAAEVAGLCLRQVVRAVAQVPEHRVLGAHVDAVWIRGEAPEIFPDATWKRKNFGSFRGYAIGWYDLGERRARAGIPDGWTRDPVLDLKKTSRATKLSRAWHKDPMQAEEATSYPRALGLAPLTRHPDDEV